jgi:PilZ domain
MLRSFLLTRDENTARVIGRIFKDLDVELHHCSEHAGAVATIVQGRYDALIFDDAVLEAANILERILEHTSCSKAVRITLADPSVSLNPVFKSGTQVVLYKPLSAERVRHGLRAVRNLMARDRRRGMKRIRTMIPARLRQGRSAGTQILIADLSDSGAAINCVDDEIPNSHNFYLDFALPGDAERMHVLSEVVWQDIGGSAGVRFLDMPSSARKRLSEWLKAQANPAPENSLTYANGAGL